MSSQSRGYLQLQEAIGTENFHNLKAHLVKNGFNFPELSDWSERDIADITAEALPSVSVVKRRKFAAEVVKYFKQQSKPNDVSKQDGGFADCVPGPRRQLLIEETEKDNASMQLAFTLMRRTYREAMKLLESIEDTKLVSDALSRCDPGFLSNLGHLLMEVENDNDANPLSPSLKAVLHLVSNSDLLHTAELREEWRSRAAYLRGKTPCCANKNKARLDLVPLYDSMGLLIPDLRENGRRPLDDMEKQHVHLDVGVNSKKSVSTTGSICAQNRNTFASRFHLFTHGVFKYFTWDDAFVAGGAVLACLANWTPPPPRRFGRRSQQTNPDLEIDLDTVRFTLVGGLKTRFNIPTEVSNHICDFLEPSSLEYNYRRASQPHPFSKQVNIAPDSSDIDVFLAAKSEEEAVEKLVKAAREISRGMLEARENQPWMDDYMEDEEDDDFEELKRVQVVRTANAMTLWVGYPIRNVQIIVVLYHSIHEVLSFFDLDCVCFGYDGHQVYGLRRGIRALQTNTNFIEPTKLRRWSTPPRILKYAQRGFNALLFEVCKHEPRCDVEPDEEIVLRVQSIKEALKKIRTGGPNEEAEFGYGLIDVPYHPKITAVNRFREHMATHTIGNGKFGQSQDRSKPKQRTIINSEGRMISYDATALTPKYYIGDATQIEKLVNIEGDENSLVPPVRWKVDDLWASRRGNEFLPRCYMCGERIDPSQTISERPQLCCLCEQINESKRVQTANLSEAVAIVTGARVKVGYAITLKLLRIGARVHATSRFPHDALRRYQDEEDYNSFANRLFVHGLDFCNVDSLSDFTATIVKTETKIDILINNAAQTIVRPREYYESALSAEEAGVSGLKTALKSPDQVRVYCDPNASSSLRAENTIATATKLLPTSSSTQPSTKITEAPEQDSRVVDAHGELLDKRDKTSWTATVENVGLVEATAAHLVNSVAPLHLLSTFHNLLVKPSKLGNGWSFVVNVTSPEGQFSQTMKGGNHPHTNMAKASLNMLTRTVAASLAGERVFVSSVDSGWVSQMTSRQITPPPLTCDDSAARVLDPILAPLVAFSALGTAIDDDSTPRCGVLFKHFNIVPW